MGLVSLYMIISIKRFNVKKILFSLFVYFCSILSSSAQTYESQFAKCSEQIKRLEEVDSLYFARVRDRDICLMGAIAPNFKVTSISGQEIELGKLKGKVVVLNFWFTKCIPCIREMPDLNKLVDHYANKNVKFISFAPENALSLESFFQKHTFKFVPIAESEDIRREKFKLFSAWPYAIIIDKDGKIAKMWSGNAGGDLFSFYKTIIDELL